MPYAHRTRSHTVSALRLLLAFAALASIHATVAEAGSYTINGTCGLWDPYNVDPAHIAVYGGCGGLIARNAGGNFSTPVNGTGGGWRFVAPGGTGISGASIS